MLQISQILCQQLIMLALSFLLQIYWDGGSHFLSSCLSCRKYWCIFQKNYRLNMCYCIRVVSLLLLVFIKKKQKRIIFHYVEVIFTSFLSWGFITVALNILDAFKNNLLLYEVSTFATKCCWYTLLLFRTYLSMQEILKL